MSKIVGRWVPAKEERSGLWFIMEVIGPPAEGRIPTVVVRSGIGEEHYARRLCDQENARKGLGGDEAALRPV